VPASPCDRKQLTVGVTDGVPAGTPHGAGSQFGRRPYFDFVRHWLQFSRPSPNGQILIFDSGREPFEAAGLQLAAQQRPTRSASHIRHRPTRATDRSVRYPAIFIPRATAARIGDPPGVAARYLDGSTAPNGCGRWT